MSITGNITPEPGDSTPPAQLVPFSFDDKEVRVHVREGEPWWVLADVAAVLEHSNSRMMAERLDPDEKGVSIADTPGGPQALAVINESGLWSLVLTSRKPEAKRFKRWITSEVIPSIRKTGGYMVAAPDETPEELAARALKVLQATVDRQREQLAVAAPKADALDRIAEADGRFNITGAAKALQMRPKDLFGYLERNGWIYRRPGGQSYLGYQSKTTAGLLEHKVTTILRADGSEKVTEQVLVTARGLTRLATLIKPMGLV